MNEKYVVTEYGIMNDNECLDKFVRVISTKEELEELLERIPYIQTIQAPNNKLRNELYQSAMNEYDDIECPIIDAATNIRIIISGMDEKIAAKAIQNYFDIV